MNRALIGYTGFVGSTINRAMDVTDVYNSQNIGSIAGRHFDEVVCAGIPAVKWLANREPERDWDTIRRLLDVLETVTTKRFVLISTIDVYPDATQPLDESDLPDPALNHAYGKHRREVEIWCERFDDRMIVRLPALFGTGLKKNIIFDLLNDNQVDRIDPASSFQWYPLARLGDDIARARDAQLGLVNLFPESVPTRDLLERFFPGAVVAHPSASPPIYQLRTRYASTFGGPPGYVMSREDVLDSLEVYLASISMSQ